MDCCTVSIGYSFKMCFSLFLLFSTPHPTSDSLFYENGLVDGSVTKKYSCQVSTPTLRNDGACPLTAAQHS